MIRRVILIGLLLAGAAGAQESRELDQLFAALKAAPGAEATALVEARIRNVMVAQASPVVRLVLERGARELAQNAPREAFSSFNAAITLQPALAEAWHGRGVAQLQLGDTAGAVADLKQALKHQPRDVFVLEDLSHAQEARGDRHGALAAWQKLLALAPKTQGGATRLRDLRLKAVGQGI